MTLLTTVFAAIICTIVWYKNAPHSEMKVGHPMLDVLGRFYYVVCGCHF